MTSNQYDLVVLNGHIIDPDSGRDGPGNISIKDKKIAIISKDLLSGTKVIDAKGQFVAPGFIGLHSHSSFQVTGAWIQAYDGVTTALELESGKPSYSQNS